MKHIKEYNEIDFNNTESNTDVPTGFKKFDIKNDQLNIGDIFYKFDPDISDLPPIELQPTLWGKKCFDNGDELGEFTQTYPEELMNKWKLEYGKTVREWKKFNKEINTKGWYLFDDLYIKE